MMKKNILSMLISTTVASSLIANPIAAQAEVFYNVSRAMNHTKQADDTIQQVMNIHDRQRSHDLITLWIAPYGECDAQGDGSEGKPFCDISQASQKLDELYNQGKARGDVDIRFKTGNNRVYKPQVGKRFGSFTFSPTAGHVVRFIPDWYQNVKDLENITMDKMVNFKGNPRGVAQNRDSNVGIRIEPRVNRGGTYQISGLHFDTFINPLSFINTHVTTDNIVDANDPESVYKHLRYSKNAAFNHMLISHNYFDKIGSTYTDQGGNYISSSLRIWGVTNSVIKNNTFINGNAIPKEVGPSHVIYTYMSADNVYDNNTFKDNVYSGPKIRVSNDEIFMNNVFDHPKSGYPLILTGYQDIRFGKGGEQDNKLYAECKGLGPYYENLGNTFKQQNKVNFTNNKEQAYCTDSKRITDPMFVEGVQTGDFEYSIRWGEADTLGDEVKSYHVYVGNIDSKGYPVEKARLLKTVDATTRELTMTKDMLDKAGMKPGEDFYYYIVAEGNSGWTSGRTQHRMTINLDENYKGREHYHVARSEPFDRLDNGKKPEKTTFSYDLVSSQLDPTYGEKNVKTGEKVVQKLSLDKIPVYTTFKIDGKEFPGKVSVNAKTGELTVDTQGVEDGEYTINVEVQYGDWSKDTAPFILSIGDKQKDNPEENPEDNINDNPVEEQPEEEKDQDNQEDRDHINITEEVIEDENPVNKEENEKGEEENITDISTSDSFDKNKENSSNKEKSVVKDTTNKNITTDIDNQSEDKKKNQTDNDAIANTRIENRNDAYHKDSKEQKEDHQYENVDGILHNREDIQGIAQKENPNRKENNQTIPLQERDNRNYQPIIRNDYQNHQQSFIMKSYAGPSVHTGGEIEQQTLLEKIIGIFN